MLGISGVTAIAARAEELGNDPNFRESFDIVTARAVASLPVLCELCLPFVKVGGKMIAMKSQQASDEISSAQNCIKLCGGEISEVISCNLTSKNGDIDERNLIIIKKVKKTPQLYPRHYSKISKKPL
jgi:16S rRNA (guanine527-N7)-methyltransferase